MLVFLFKVGLIVSNWDVVEMTETDTQIIVYFRIFTGHERKSFEIKFQQKP